MELLLDNLRAALSPKKEEKDRKKRSQADLGMVAKAVALVALTVLASRVSFFSFMYPCGIGLLAVLMDKSRANIYIMPFILLGIWSSPTAGYGVWGDMAAVLLCTAALFVAAKKETSLPVKAVMAGVITAAVKTAYAVYSHIFYMYDGILIGVEAMLILLFAFIFHQFLQLMDYQHKVTATVPENVVVLCTVGMLVIAGVFPATVLFLSPVMIGGLFLVLFTGAKLGTMEGAAAGVAAGLMVMALTSGTPAVLGIFACAGMCAGLLRQEHKAVTALCFAAVCVVFGLLRGYPNLYMSVYEPLIAGAVFFLIPDKVMKYGDALMARAGKDDSYYELLAKKKIKGVLKNYHQTFDDLAIAYSKNRIAEAGTSPSLSPMDAVALRSAQNSRKIMAYQFRGMAKAIETMTEEIEKPDRHQTIRAVRLGIRLGISTYAKNEDISGDSYLCTDVRHGEYMVALSDGMGKGAKAAEESSLTVNTLYNLMKAGFDVELALKIINSILLVKSTEEIFSTVDLGMLDLCTGRMRLFKIGAAATFIKRGDYVEVIKVSALPIGIVDQIPIDCVEVSLRKGDQVIIVSDGITDADRSGFGLDWLKDCIVSIKSKDPQTMSDLIINKAIERCGLKERDDMTVIVTSIE